MAAAVENLPIQYFVFMKAETTGQHWNDVFKTKIVELSMIAVNRRDIENGVARSMPAAQKLNMVFRPGRYIQEEATNSHDLTVDYVDNSPTFEQCAQSIVSFLHHLKKPVCLVAHNGGSFDFKHLKEEFLNAGVSWPEDLLCVDSMWIFYYILKANPNNTIKKATTSENIYKILFNELCDPVTAESKSLMILDCALLTKEYFLVLAEQRKLLFNDVKVIGQKTIKNRVPTKAKVAQ